jgi:hypothetical protein
MAITRFSKGRTSFSGKDLKPWISSAFRYNGLLLYFPSLSAKAPFAPNWHI